MLALAGGTIYTSPAEEPIRDGVLLIDGDKIAEVSSSVPEKAQTVDCSGLTITAGFWNSHMHFAERKWANAETIPAPELGRQLHDMLTRYGFTSVFDLSSIWQNTKRLRDRIESGEVPGPRIFSTGQGLVPPGPSPPDTVINMMGWVKTPLTELTDAVQAASAVKHLLNEGVDAIKLFVSSYTNNLLPGDAIEAAVREAHRSRNPVFAHPNNGDDVLSAVQNGVDVIAHTTPRSGPWDKIILAAMMEHRVALTPTLWLWKFYSRHDRVSAQDEIVRTATSQLRDWVALGGTVLFGTDLGAVDYDPSEEYALMREAGMSFRQILASLTTAPAERFGESQRSGRIAAGFQADIVAFKGESLADVRYTLRGGRVIAQRSPY